MTTAAQRRRRIGWGVGLALAGAVIGMVIGWLVAIELEGERDAAQQQAGAAKDSLDALCEAGYQSACDQLGSLPDVDDPEQQELEIQEPEVQEPEIQEPEFPDAERQDDERQDDEVQDLEEQEAEIQDPEIQDDEVQDPEVDDPDPNSALQFAFRDDCNPPPGHVVTDTGGRIERGDGVVTFVVTCDTAPASNPGNPNEGARR